MESLPNWLQKFVGLTYFKVPGCSICPKECEKNFFCVDCSKGPLCPVENEAEHSTHRVLQVRMASGRCAVGLDDIEALVKTDDICQYVINNANILKLQWNGRGKDKVEQHICKWGNKPLIDLVRFCSITCKMKFLINNPSDASVTFALPVGASKCSIELPEKRQAKEKKQAKKSKVVSRVPKLLVEEEKRLSEDLEEDKHLPNTIPLGLNLEADIRRSTQQNFSSREKSRKGIPQRAWGVGIIM